MKYFIVIIFLFSSLCFANKGRSTPYEELINPDTNGRVWVYLPENYNKDPVSVVLIPPAGTRLFHGIDLSIGDSHEHIPYVEEGFAVISFDLSGSWPAIETDKNTLSAINNYVERNSGVDDAKDALTLAKKKFPKLNTNIVYVAGHSSAGTISLMIAKQLPGVKAVIAYAPVINTESYLADIANAVDNKIPNFRKVLIDKSPHKDISKYTMPVFLFSAKDDAHTLDQENSYKMFIEKFKKSGGQLTYKQVKSGGHYQSMIDEGIPLAIEWLKSLDPKK